MSSEEEIPLEATATASELAAAAAAEPAEEESPVDDAPANMVPDLTSVQADDTDPSPVKENETDALPQPPDPPAPLATSPFAHSSYTTLPMMNELTGAGVVATGQENTGRWTKIEHAAFLKGIENYGKEWKKVASMVRTRTVMQTRTHAQKYFEKLAHIVAKQNGTPAGRISTSISSNKRLDSKDAKEKKKAAAALKSPARTNLSAVFSSPTSPAPIVAFTDTDILVPISDSTALRSANKEYMDVMKANCFIFHSLPLAEQAWFVRNLVNFITVVRGRRWVACNFYHPNTAPQYQLLPDPTTVVQNDFRMDPLKIAGFAFHPFWLLGEHDPGNAHNGMPFLHRTIDGSWKAVTTSQVRDILKGEGPKNLLLMPPSVHLEAAYKGIPTPVAASTVALPDSEARSDVNQEINTDDVVAAESEDVPDLPHATMDDPVDVADPNDISPDDAATAAALAVTLTRVDEPDDDDNEEIPEEEDDTTGKIALVDELVEEVTTKKPENKSVGTKRSVAQKSLPVTRKVQADEDEDEDDNDEDEAVEEKNKGTVTRGTKRGVKEEGEKVDSAKKATRATVKAKDPEPEGQRRSKRQRG